MEKGLERYLYFDNDKNFGDFSYDLTGTLLLADLSVYLLSRLLLSSPQVFTSSLFSHT